MWQSMTWRRKYKKDTPNAKASRASFLLPRDFENLAAFIEPPPAPCSPKPGRKRIDHYSINPRWIYNLIIPFTRLAVAVTVEAVNITGPGI